MAHSVFPYDFPKTFLRSFENVGPVAQHLTCTEIVLIHALQVCYC